MVINTFLPGEPQGNLPITWSEVLAAPALKKHLEAWRERQEQTPAASIQGDGIGWSQLHSWTLDNPGYVWRWGSDSRCSLLGYRLEANDFQGTGLRNPRFVQ